MREDSRSRIQIARDAEDKRLRTLFTAAEEKLKTAKTPRAVARLRTETLSQITPQSDATVALRLKVHGIATAPYLGNFDQIHSEFTAHREADGLGVMEWIATGRLKGGRDLKYRGVSLITLDGDRVKVFRTYYDSAAFVAPVAEEV